MDLLDWVSADAVAAVTLLLLLLLAVMMLLWCCCWRERLGLCEIDLVRGRPERKGCLFAAGDANGKRADPT